MIDVRKVLEWIVAQQYQDRDTVTHENAFEAFQKLNATVCAIYERAGQALSIVPSEEVRDADIRAKAAAFDRLIKVLYDSGTYDNFECNYGPTLGTCPESNSCIECSLYREVQALAPTSQ